MTQPERMCVTKLLRNHPHADWWSYGPWTGERVKSALVRTRTEAGECRYEHCGSPVGLDMLMFTDGIFVPMSKSHLRNDTVDQQERARHLRPYLPLENIHHRSRHLTLFRAYIIVMLHVHHLCFLLVCPLIFVVSVDWSHEGNLCRWITIIQTLKTLTSS
jgi:hypothetical protein